MCNLSYSRTESVPVLKVLENDQTRFIYSVPVVEHRIAFPPFLTLLFYGGHVPRGGDLISECGKGQTRRYKNGESRTYFDKKSCRDNRMLCVVMLIIVVVLEADNANIS